MTVVDPQLFGAGDPCHNESLALLKNMPDGKWDAVIHLASISNNDMYAKDRTRCESVNRWVPLPECERLIYASSVAAYGTSDEVLTEESELKPTTPYGEDKARCEAVVFAVGGTVVRAASVCGHSPNMRFDTPINRMTRDAVIKGTVTVNGGEQYRCHIHIDDLCDFYRLLLKAPKEKIKGEAFNAVESTTKIKTTGEWISRFLDARLEYRPSADSRSYKVSGDKARKVLDWVPRRDTHDVTDIKNPTMGAIRGMKAQWGPQYVDFSPARMRML